MKMIVSRWQSLAFPGAFMACAVVGAQLQAQARHLYTDGIERADPEDFDAATNGYSVAHWEGNEQSIIPPKQD